MVILRSTGETATLRREWGENLKAHLDAPDPPVSRKELQRRLAALGVEVSLQAISQWIRGETSPRPAMQSAIGRVLGVPPQSLFPLPKIDPSAR